MHYYTFTGASPRVLTGLSQGVNAGVIYSPAGNPPYGSTIEACPGTHIRTDEPYVHPELEEFVPEASDAHGLSPEDEAWAQANPVPGWVPAPVVEPAAPVEAPVAPPVEAAPAPVAEPAHDVMTAEGAPAPAEPTL